MSVCLYILSVHVTYTCVYVGGGGGGGGGVGGCVMCACVMCVCVLTAVGTIQILCVQTSSQTESLHLPHVPI